ncbi:MAG: nitroreductase family protein [Dehalococcoidia bacterium]|nr:nitroreductase family protein [Dehalococcoidia bacterium]
MELKSPDETGLFEALYSTRALRRFKPDPVPDEVLFQVIDAAIRAPAGSNQQVWHFLVVRDEAKRKAIGEAYWQTWTSYGKQYVDDPSAIDRLPRQMRLVVRSTDHLARHIAEVPVHLFVCGPAQAAGTIYPAVQNALLACRGLGLGSVVTAFHRGHDATLKPLLGVPDDVTLHALLPIGYPEDKIGPVGRRPVKKHASLDTYGEPWPFAESQPDEGWHERWVHE